MATTSDLSPCARPPLAGVHTVRNSCGTAPFSSVPVTFPRASPVSGRLGGRTSGDTNPALPTLLSPHSRCWRSRRRPVTLRRGGRVPRSPSRRGSSRPATSIFSEIDGSTFTSPDVNPVAPTAKWPGDPPEPSVPRHRGEPHRIRHRVLHADDVRGGVGEPGQPPAFDQRVAHVQHDTQLRDRGHDGAVVLDPARRRDVRVHRLVDHDQVRARLPRVPRRADRRGDVVPTLAAWPRSRPSVHRRGRPRPARRTRRCSRPMSRRRCRRRATGPGWRRVFRVREGLLKGLWVPQGVLHGPRCRR